MWKWNLEEKHFTFSAILGVIQVSNRLASVAKSCEICKKKASLIPTSTKQFFSVEGTMKSSRQECSRQRWRSPFAATFFDLKWFVAFVAVSIKLFFTFLLSKIDKKLNFGQNLIVGSSGGPILACKIHFGCNVLDRNFFKNPQKNVFFYLIFHRNSDWIPMKIFGRY
jgi:hypothetical protein